MKKLVLVLIIVVTMAAAAMAQSHFVVGPFNWSDTYVTSDAEAIALIQEYKGTNAEFVQYKGRYSLDMSSPEAWNGYNAISRNYNTNKATMLKQLKGGVWVVFAFENGQLRYGNCFTTNNK